MVHGCLSMTIETMVYQPWSIDKLKSMTYKKHTLKPGKHQFAPGEYARHHNDHLTDAEAEWYLARYPHIIKLFVSQPPDGQVIIQKNENMELNVNKRKRVRKLTPPSGGKGDV